MNSTTLSCPPSSLLHLAPSLVNITSAQPLIIQDHSFLLQINLLPKLMTLCQNKESCMYRWTTMTHMTSIEEQVMVNIQPACSLVVPTGKVALFSRLLRENKKDVPWASCQLDQNVQTTVKVHTEFNYILYQKFVCFFKHIKFAQKKHKYS